MTEPYLQRYGSAMSEQLSLTFGMNESERRAVEQVRVLWPHLGMWERIEWVERLRHLFEDDFVKTVEALTWGKS